MKPDRKRGGLEAIFVLAAISIVVVVFFAGWLYGHGLITDTLVGIETQEGQPNISWAAQSTIVYVDNGIQFLKFIAFVIFFGLAISLFITNFFVKAHPYLYIVYIFISVLAVVFSVYIGNAYEALLSNTAISDTMLEFTAMNFVMQNFPTIIAVVSLFGAILLFINLPRDPGLASRL
jgi:hypothetical protein